MCCLYIYIDLYKEQLLVQTTMADILSGDTLSHQIYSFQLSVEQDIGLKDQLPLNIMTMSRLNPFIYNSYFFQTYRICDLIIFNCLLLFDALMPLFYNKKQYIHHPPSNQIGYFHLYRHVNSIALHGRSPFAQFLAFRFYLEIYGCSAEFLAFLEAIVVKYSCLF